MSADAKFPDYVAPTKLTYLEGRPAEIHIRRCRIVMQRGNQQREKVFDQHEITLGAMSDNDLIVNHESVSRHHCKIIQEPNGYILADLGSTNGTFINRVRIREGYLKPGCTIQIGKVEIGFQSADEKVSIVPSRKNRLGHLVGRSVKMREIYGIIEKIATTGTTVVIEGETGTGKEVVAQTIHELSDRAAGKLMVFDCGAVPENLIESELFGHEKGSFTGAIMARQGIFEMANGGTIFLDELGELSLELQPKLLRVLERREVRRVGANKTARVDVRVIAATNRSLEQEVQEGRFREDLFYRLSVVRITLPPLRERPEDIPLLIDHLLERQQFNRRPDGTLKVEHVDRSALDMLTSYRWPGNVRELVNVIERAISFTEGDTIRCEDLPETLRLSGASPGVSAAADDKTFKDAKERWVSSFERDYVLTLLKKNGGNISQASRDADIDRKYFRKLMRKYGIDADQAES